MPDQPNKNSNLTSKELAKHVERALREAGKLAKKRAEEAGVPLVVRDEHGLSDQVKIYSGACHARKDR